ncbi:MAG: hypothetical protein KatS3mg128_0528 [Silanimonas sp.]|nr:MAG: hypothetical protein KatS3mg128_0528 [Silanimonas sp.]
MLAGIVTATLLAAFLGGVFWLFVLRKPSDFERMARQPLEDNTEEDRP